MKASKFRVLGVLALFLIGIMAISSVVSAVSVDTDTVEVKINGEVVDKNGGDTLDIDRGEDIEIKVRFEATGNDTNTELHAFIAGYEYGDKETLADQSHVFDVEAGVTYVETLEMSLPDRLDRQLYRLRLFFADNDDPIMVSDYFLKVGTQRHELKIKDVVLSPENAIQAGRALIGVVRIKNTGEKDEQGIKVRMSVPGLGISATDYIDELESEETTTTEELYMRVPQCVSAGTYEVITELSYDEGYETVTESDLITVTEGDSCTPISSGIRVTVPASSQAVNAGEQTVFPLTIQNLGADAKQVTVSAQAGSEIEASVNEPVVVLDGEETKVVLVNARASEDASGEQLITLKVGSGDKTQDITLKVDVNEGATSGFSKIKKGLEVGLVVLVVLLVILGLIIGFNRLKGSEDESSEEAGQTYY